MRFMFVAVLLLACTSPVSASIVISGLFGTGVDGSGNPLGDGASRSALHDHELHRSRVPSPHRRIDSADLRRPHLALRRLPRQLRRQLVHLPVDRTGHPDDVPQRFQLGRLASSTKSHSTSPASILRPPSSPVRGPATTTAASTSTTIRPAMSKAKTATSRSKPSPSPPALSPASTSCSSS